MKYRQPDPPQALFRHKHRHESQCAQQFKKEDAFQNKPGEPYNTAHLGRGNGILHGAALHQRNPLAGGHGDGNGNRYHAHAANLNQQQNHSLPKKRPVGGRIMYNEAGDANRRCGGKQAVQEGGSLSGGRRGGQHQQSGPHQNHHQKSKKNDLGRGQLFMNHLRRHTAISLVSYCGNIIANPV